MCIVLAALVSLIYHKYMKFNLRILLFIVTASLSACSQSSVNQSAMPRTPDHLVLMVFDAMRPDYIDRFNLKNFKKLRSLSQNYSEASVGYIGAETVVSHLVIPSGRKPKDLPWGDDVMFDRQGALGEPGRFYASGDLSFDQLTKLMNTLPSSQFLSFELKKKLGGKVYAIGQKNYATTVMGTPEADAIITIKKKNGRCSVDGLHVPTRLAAMDRFNLDCSQKYGTENTFYPYDGNRFVPGNDPLHIGGDAWVADMAFEVMDQKDWSGLFLTFGSIDKVAHQLGEQDGARPSPTQNVQTPYTLPILLQIADIQLGRILDRLERDRLLDRTMIVVTADHGGQSNYQYLGNGKTSKWGPIKDESQDETPAYVRSFTKFKGVKFSYEDSAIRTWLEPDADLKHIVAAMKKVPGIIEIYHLKNIDQKWVYQNIFSSLKKLPKPARQWALRNNANIVDAAANESAPTLMGLLADNVGFDLMGDHGGAQEHVQRVPLIMFIPELPGKDILEEIHLYDVKSKIEKVLQL